MERQKYFKTRFNKYALELIVFDVCGYDLENNSLIEVFIYNLFARRIFPGVSPVTFLNALRKATSD